MIRLADSSELGWRTVNEYQSNPLASDSEDEKRIYKAEARASRKARKDKKKPNRSFPYKRPSESPAAPGSARAQSRPGACFACGKLGHWKKECFAVQNTGSNNKLSTLIISNETLCKDKNGNSYHVRK